MSQDGYAVDLEMLETVERRLEGFVGFAKDQLTTIESLVNSTPERWTGAAADAYFTRHTAWATKAAAAVEALDQIRTRLKNARTAYQASLDANNQMFG
ncbi:WXG100 family type VII secretion target [Nocardia sp. NPDC050378]|uniref:WXG100 family type VII secretion target n=1 Tax=Nocardia sp. NPDC050378 TaxID=3155400 RepID=UPI00340E361B